MFETDQSHLERYFENSYKAQSEKLVLKPLLIKMRIDPNVAKVENHIKPIASISTRISKGSLLA
jgi:hypothetical protein